MLEPGVSDAWSIRDVIAHVTTWEEEALKYLPLILDGGQPPHYSQAYGGVDAFNALMMKRKEGLSLLDVLRQQHESHSRLVRLVERAPEDHLMRETRFRRRLRQDTYRHYPMHAEAIRTWREQHVG